MFERFIITDHIVQRYRFRVRAMKKKDIYRRIKDDLHFSKVIKIINDGKTRHVFTRNSKEFIFINDNGKWILKTVIKRSRETRGRAISRRLAEASN